MLRPDYLEGLPDALVELYAQAEVDILADMARRISTYDYWIPAAEWQRKKLVEMGATHDYIMSRLSKLTGKSSAELTQLFEDAGSIALDADNGIYKAQGLNPPALNTAKSLQNVLISGLTKTKGIFRNLTKTTANTATKQFENALDQAYMQITTGAFDYNAAIRTAVKDLAKQGVGAIAYPSGHVDTIEVAVRRAVVTGVNQTALQLQTTLADEMGCDLVETTAHAGARPSHAAWQGKVFSRSGKSDKYPDFVRETGYGTGAGLGGWNCRHNFFPYFEGSPRAYTPDMLQQYEAKDYEYNGQKMTEYEATQQQRYMERQIRRWKRENIAMQNAGLDASESAAKIAHWERTQSAFLSQTGMKRQSDREQVSGWGKKQAQQAVQTHKKAVAEYAAKHATAALHTESASGIINTEVWKFTDRKKADAAFRPLTEKVWPYLSSGERRAAYRYTEGSGAFNRPLRGYDKSWDRFVGAGKISLNNEGAGAMIRDLQTAIAKVELPADTWLFRGSDQQSLAGLLGIDKAKIIPSNVGTLNKKFSGKDVQDLAFFSTGISADAGFNDKIAYEVFAPKGTYGLYAEPFSRFGGTNTTGNWDGKQTSSMVGTEAEVILHAGTWFHVRDIRLVDGKITVSLEVIPE